MISDVLYEALRDIRSYQLDEPEMYDGLRQEIDEVRVAMAKLLAQLDTTAAPEELSQNPIYQALLRGDIGPWDEWMES